MPAAQRTPITLAVATLRRRNSRSGISGSAHARLDDQEQRQQEHGRTEQALRLRRRPAGFVAADDGVHRQHQARGDGDGARDIEPARTLRGTIARQQRDAERVNRDADRQVDQEDPVPAEHVRHDTAEQLADAAAGRAHEAIDSHRLRPLGRLREQVHDQRQRDRRDHRAAHALHRAGNDQRRLRLRQPADQRGEREQARVRSRNSRRWPYRSPSRPPSSRKPPKVSM